jgi:hypothetical protein
MENTLSFLNKKIWYRSAKVFYLLLYLIFIIGFNFLNYSWNKEAKLDINKIKIQTIEGKSQVEFNNGTKIIFDGKPNVKDVEEAIYDADVNPFFYQSNFLIIKDFIIFFLIGNIIIVAIFEAIRRIFYYIILGKIYPKE